MESHPKFKETVSLLIDRVIILAQSARDLPLDQIIHESEICTDHIRALASLIAENGMFVFYTL